MDKQPIENAEALPGKIILGHIKFYNRTAPESIQWRKE